MARSRPDEVVGSGINLNLGNAIVKGDGQLVRSRGLCRESSAAAAGTGRIQVSVNRVNLQVITGFKGEVAAFKLAGGDGSALNLYVKCITRRLGEGVPVEDRLEDLRIAISIRVSGQAFEYQQILSSNFKVAGRGDFNVGIGRHAAVNNSQSVAGGSRLILIIACCSGDNRYSTLRKRVYSTICINGCHSRVGVLGKCVCDRGLNSAQSRNGHDPFACGEVIFRTCSRSESEFLRSTAGVDGYRLSIGLLITC